MEELEKIKADVTLDAVGLFCPVPILKTSIKMKELKIGQVLEVLADDEGIKEDMPAWCKSTGNECLGLEKDGDVYKVYVRKTKE